MKILGHRGKWKDPDKKNSLEALNLCLESGFGIETDIRDFQGEIVISHDPPMGKEPLLSELLRMFQGKSLPIALNVKSDGLSIKLKILLEKFKIDNYFTFDMSIPELSKQVELGLKVFTGLSDINPNPILLDKCCGVWLDGFFQDWYSPKLINNLFAQNKMIGLVSSELHGRDYISQWKKILPYKNENFFLCTDYPDEAKKFFHHD